MPRSSRGHLILSANLKKTLIFFYQQNLMRGLVQLHLINLPKRMRSLLQLVLHLINAYIFSSFVLLSTFFFLRILCFSSSCCIFFNSTNIELCDNALKLLVVISNIIDARIVLFAILASLCFLGLGTIIPYEPLCQIICLTFLKVLFI